MVTTCAACKRIEVIARRSISTTFDSAGAELIWTRLILTLCDRVAIGRLSPFDHCCANLKRLWFLHEACGHMGITRAIIINSRVMVWSECPRRIASRRGRSLQRSSRYLPREQVIGAFGPPW
jgi:hypothetical protein